MKKFLIALFSLYLSSCGFTPMYSAQDTDIYVSPISGINGIDLRNALWAKFGGQRTSNAEYRLDVSLNSPVTQYKALGQAGDATWQEISLTANYVLLHNGVRIAAGTETAAESYTFVRYLVASNASYNNAIQNAIRVLSDKISTRAIAETYKISTKQTKK